jgi:hypothetical protein
MPLLSPNQIHQALKVSGPATKELSRRADLVELLENNNLTPDEILMNLSSLLRSGENDGVRLRAAEMGLKLNKLLGDDSQRPDFQVTINIIDSEFTTLNPILIPRETSI